MQNAHNRHKMKKYIITNPPGFRKKILSKNTFKTKKRIQQFITPSATFQRSEKEDIFKDYENSQLLLNVDKNKDINLKYGDKIYIKAEYTKPSTKRNFGGFDYSNYLKSINVYGTLKAEKINKISENNLNIISLLSNKVKLKISDNINKLMTEKYSSIFLGLILGDTKNIDETIQDSFKVANISHVLAISGMHITYIILGVELILKKPTGKRKTR